MKINPQSGKSLVANYIYNMLYEVVAVLTPLIMTPYVLRVLPVQDLGLYSYSYSIVLYFTAFVVLGTKCYAIKKIAQAGDIYERSQVFYEVFSLRLLTGILSLLGYFLVSIMGTVSPVIYSLQAIYILACIFDISWFFQGLENFKAIVLRNIAFKVLTLLSVLLFVRNSSDLPVYILSQAGLTFLGNVSLFFYLPKYTSRVSIRSLNPFRGIKEILVLFIPTIAYQIYAALDKTMLGVICQGMEQSAYYAQADKIVRLILTIVTSISTVMLPRISKLTKDDPTLMKQYTAKSFQCVSLLSIPMIFGLCAVADLFVPWFLGEQYSDVTYLIYILSPMFFIMGLSNITGLQYLVATNRQGVYSASIVIGTVFNCLLNAVLIPRMGAAGAALSTVFSEFMIAGLEFIFVFVIKKELSFKACFSQTFKHIIASLIMALVVIYGKNTTDSIIVLPVLIAIGFGVYLLMLKVMKETIITGFTVRRKR